MASPDGLPFVQARVRPEVRAAVEAAAEAEGVNRGEIIRRAIVEYLTAHGHPTAVPAEIEGQQALEVVGA